MLKEFLITDNKELNIEKSLFSGQSFIWQKHQSNLDSFVTVMDKRLIIVSQLSPYTIKVHCDSEVLYGQEISAFISHYFTLDVPFQKIFLSSFKSNYSEVWRLLDWYKSIALLRQHPFETLISFMCAQGIGMRLIRQQINRLCERYGEFYEAEMEGKMLRLSGFPAPEQLACLNAEELSYCTNNNRERAANIIAVARKVVEGRLDLSSLSYPNMAFEEVQARLTQERGIGLKIADCVALFGLGHFEAFPIDTHVHQFMAQWFKVPAASRSLTPATYRQLTLEAREILGSHYTGYAAHLLFHCWRCEVKKLCWF